MATRQTANTRAKDDDRTKTCQILDGALGDGQLSMEEHRQRVATATSAATLGDLQALVADLQTDHAPIQPPEPERPARSAATGRRSWGYPAAVTAVLVVLGIAIGWGLYGNSSSPLDFTTDPGAKADGVVPIVVTPPTELQSLGGLSGLFEQMRKKFGDTRGYSLSIRPQRADLSRPDPRDDRRVLSYTYQGGWGDPSSTTRGSDTRVVNLAQFDYAAIIGMVRGAPQILNLGSQNITETRIDIDPSKDPLTPEAVDIQIYVTGEFSGGYIQVAPDGSCKRCVPVS